MRNGDLAVDKNWPGKEEFHEAKFQSFRGFEGFTHRQTRFQTDSSPVLLRLGSDRSAIPKFRPFVNGKTDEERSLRIPGLRVCGTAVL